MKYQAIESFFTNREKENQNLQRVVVSFAWVFVVDKWEQPAAWKLPGYLRTVGGIGCHRNEPIACWTRPDSEALPSRDVLVSLGQST